MINYLKNCTKLIILVFALIVFIDTHESFSQENYLPGYIIKSGGDSISGLIDYRNWERNPNQIKFKEKSDAGVLKFNPVELNKFDVGGEVYFGAIIYKETSPYKVSNLNDNPEIQLEVDTVFLQTIIEGEKSLYFFKSKGGKENFYIRKDSVFELLSYKKYLKVQHGSPDILEGNKNTVISENNRFLGQLNIYLQSCPEIHAKLEKTKYDMKSLINLFQNYYGCVQNEPLFQKKVEKVKIETGLLSGISVTKAVFEGKNGFKELTRNNFKPSTSITAGLFLNFVLPRSQRKWSINNEILFSKYNFEGELSEIQSSNQYSVTSFEMGYSYLKMNNMLGYKYPIKGSFIFFHLGFSNGIAISETNYKITQSTFYSTVTLREDEIVPEARKHEQGYILGLGIKKGKVSFETRFEQGNGISSYNNLISKTNNYYFLLGFKF